VAERRAGAVPAGRAVILLWQVLVGVAVLLSWQGLVSLKILDPFFVSRPTAIAQRVAAWTAGGSLWPHLATTLEEALLGLLIGAAMGISLGFSLATAEHALAREACSIARVFEAAGIAFDPLTFVALRVVEASDEDHVDAVECLELLVRFGFLERSVALAEHLLEDAA